MKVVPTNLHVYTSTHNDLYMLKFFIRHYERFASKIFVYDDMSTDGTVEYCMSKAPLVQLMDPGFSGIDELKLQEMRNREYKIHSRGVADWVIIGDSDENHWHPDLLQRLSRLKHGGCMCVVSHGWQMFGTEAPQGNCLLMDKVRDGISDTMYDRTIFRPEIDISIGIGHHGFEIIKGNGYVLADDPVFKLLHFKYISRQTVIDRHNRSFSRLSERNRANGWGIHASPDYHDKYSVEWYDDMLGKAQPVCLD